MEKVSRRKLIVGATAGAVAIGAIAAVPLIAAEQHHPAQAATTSAIKDPIMVYVTDPSTANVTLLVGDKQVTFSDADLVARLIRAAQ